MKPRLLDDEAFHATFSTPARDVTFSAEPIIDIWPYVEAVESDDLKGHRLQDVEKVYEDGSGRWLHILVATDRTNIFLAVVVSVDRCAVEGHHLLDLNEKYGLT